MQDQGEFGSGINGPEDSRFAAAEIGCGANDSSNASYLAGKTENRKNRFSRLGGVYRLIL
jgi:hypothetical protein